MAASPIGRQQDERDRCAVAVRLDPTPASEVAIDEIARGPKPCCCVMASFATTQSRTSSGLIGSGPANGMWRITCGSFRRVRISPGSMDESGVKAITVAEDTESALGPLLGPSRVQGGQHVLLTELRRVYAERRTRIGSVPFRSPGRGDRPTGRFRCLRARLGYEGCRTRCPQDLRGPASRSHRPSEDRAAAWHRGLRPVRSRHRERGRWARGRGEHGS